MLAKKLSVVSLGSALIVAACSSSEGTPAQPRSSTPAQTGGAGNGGMPTQAATGGAANGGTAIPTGGTLPATGGATASTGGASASSGGTEAATGGAEPAVGGTATATGGVAATTAGTAAATGGAANGPFVLAWQDDFDTLDPAAWQLQTFTWEGNEAQFSTENASVSNGVVTLSLTTAPSGSQKPYLGVEMRSAKTLTYGKVSTRMRFATGSGVVSSIVLFYTPFPNCDWNEIDIEHLGKTSHSSQLNAMVYTGSPNPDCTASVAPTQDPQVVDLGFDAESDFHTYDIEWTPAGVKYFADGVLLRTWTANISLLKLPSNILLTIWASGAPEWAGALSPMSAPTSAEVDWIKVYDYVALAAAAP